MSFEQLKEQVATLSDHEQAELISFTLRLRHAHDANYRREVTDRLNGHGRSHWLTPDEFVGKVCPARDI
jgi:asparagine synthetase B (glutamine-hydrolysing)